MINTLDLGIGGMTCGACASRVERALRKVPGVRQATVNLATETARVEFQTLPDASAPTEPLLRRAVRHAGYEPRAPGLPTLEAVSPWTGFAPVGLGLLLSLPLMLPMLGGLFGRHWMLAPLWQFLLATPVQFGLGARFYKAGWQAARHGGGNMDLLVAVGTTAAWGLSMWLWLGAAEGAMPHLYFEASALVITLVRLGKWLELRAREKTGSAIRALHALRPDTVRLITATGEVELPVAEVLVGDRLLLRPGERVPADGWVEEGETQVDESMLTGEPLPVPKGPGQRLIGGAINTDGRVTMRVSAVGQETVLAGIIRLVEDAQAAKAPIQRLADRVSSVFVPVVGVLALLTLLGWWWLTGLLEPSLIPAVSVLVMACPCALGLATPVALMAGTGVAARQGILIKDIEALERACQVDTVVFDKTGTLTQGQPRLLGCLVAAGADETGMLALAARLQTGSEHPLARAVLAAAQSHGLAVTPAETLQSWPGRGCEGLVDGRRLRLASPAWLDALGLSLASFQPLLSAEPYGSATLSALLEEGRAGWEVRAVLAFADEPKPGAREALAALRARGLRVLMLSGDRRAAVVAMGARLGLSAEEVQAEVLPADKAAHVQALQQADQGHGVMMVGDGVNDAPALAAADVGMAMGQGADVAMQAAGITLLRGDLALVPVALELSRLTMAKIRQNLFWAFFYNAVGIPLAALGVLSPVLAGAAMALSSVSVLGNALLLQRWRR